MNIYLELFLAFFKIGLFTFGGGYAMISLVMETCVTKNWLTEGEILNFIAICESTPGPIAINMATFIGYKQRKVIGSMMTTLGVVLPSFIIIFTISLFLKQFMEFKYVQYAFSGINSAVAFLIVKTGFTMMKKIEKKPLPIISFILVFSLMILFDILAIKFSSIYFILIGGIFGIIYYSIFFNKKEVK